MPGAGGRLGIFPHRSHYALRFYFIADGNPNFFQKSVNGKKSFGVVYNHHVAVGPKRTGINDASGRTGPYGRAGRAGNFNTVSKNPGVQVRAVLFAELADDFALYRPRQRVRRDIDLGPGRFFGRSFGGRFFAFAFKRGQQIIQFRGGFIEFVNFFTHTIHFAFGYI